MLPCALSDRSPLIMQPTKFCLIGNKGLEGKNRLQKINELHREKSSVKFNYCRVRLSVSFYEVLNMHHFLIA